MAAASSGAAAVVATPIPGSNRLVPFEMALPISPCDLAMLATA
jgi:hypothetical protein